MAVVSELEYDYPDYKYHNTAPTGTLIIPDTVTYNEVEYKVTSIGASAFDDCSGLSGSLTIPNSVESIGNNAFNGCSGFTGTLTIPNSVESIGSYAFFNCRGLTGSLTIPNSVESIGNDAFASCSGLSGSLTIPNSVESIGDYAFYDCSGLGKLTILATTPPSLGSNNLSYIKAIYVQQGTRTNYITADGWKDYADELFFFEIGVTSEVLSLNVATAGTLCNEIDNAGKQPGTVTRLKLSGTLGDDDWDLLKDSMTTLYDLDLSEITNTTIPNEAFKGSKIVSFKFPQELISIGRYAFKQSHLCDTLELPNSVVSIGYGAFDGCSGFTGSLTIPNSVESISGSAFSDCSGFTGSLTIPNSVESIGDYAFSGCDGLRGNLTIHNSVESIGNSAFSGCSGLSGSLTIPNSVESIGDDAFFGCSGFTGTLTIPNSVKSIGEYAFYDCSGFTGNLTIPNSVESIGENAFKYCSGLSGTLTILNSVESIGKYAFSGCSGLSGTVKLPNGLSRIESYLFGNTWNENSSITHVVIPANVSSISSDAFSGCTALDTLTCLWVNPVALSEDFATIDTNTCLLQVPTGASNNYVSAAVWGSFINIQEIDIDYAITFKSNGGVGAMPIQSVIKGSSLTISENTFTKAGHTFIGWATDSISTTAEYTDGENTTLTDDIELYAVWETNTYTLSFDANGSEDTINDTIITYNAAIGTLPVLTKDGYTFDGWKIDETEIADTTVWIFTENKEATAQWSANEYTLTFNSNGGAGNMSEQIFTYGVEATITENTFTKAGHTFKGWATYYSSTEVEYTDGESISLTEDIELYAVWEEAAGIEDVQAPAPFTQVGNTLYFSEPTKVAIYNISGAMLYSGTTTEYTLPSRIGVYVVCTEVGSYKVLSR